MPALPSKAQTQYRRGTVKQQPPRRPAFQEPVSPRTAAARPQLFQAEPAQTEPDRPKEVDGIAVVTEELLFARPGAFFRISRLHLADDTTVFACRDCLFTAQGRGSVMVHRNQEHGARFGKKAPKVKFEPDKETLDIVLPSRPDGQPAPSNSKDWTLGELMAVAPSLAALGDYLDRVEEQRDNLLAALKRRDESDKNNKHKIDVYEALHDEVIELRMKIKHVGSFDEMKAELLEQRAWKKKMVQKLSALGFNFTEEE